MDTNLQLHYKKLIYISSKRGMLEIEEVLRKFVKKFVLKSYNYNEITQLIEFLETTDDITLFNYIFNNEHPSKKHKKFVDDLKSSLCQ